MRTVERRNAYFWVWEGEPDFGEPHQYDAIFCTWSRPEFERELRDKALQCLRTARAIERIEIATIFEDGTESRSIWRHAEPLTRSDYQQLAALLPNIGDGTHHALCRKFLAFRQEDAVNEQV